MDGFETYTNKTSTGNDIIVTLHQDGDAALRSACPRPTALLLGWLGASRRNVGKYAALYRAMGYHTVQTASPMSVVFSLSQTSPTPFLLSVLRVLAADARLLAGGLVIAPFSNGGAILLPKLAQLFCVAPGSAPPAPYRPPSSPSRAPLLPALDPLPHAATPPSPTSIDPQDDVDAPKCRPRRAVHPAVVRDLALHPEDLPVVAAVRASVAALVCDSCPCYLHPREGARAVAMGVGVRQESFVGMLIVVGFLALVALQRLLYGNLIVRFWEEMCTAQYPCPELYMYSAADVLLDEHALDELVAYRRKAHPLGARGVRAWRVEDAAHVQLLVSHKDVYMQQLESVTEWGLNEFRASVGLPRWELPDPSQGG